MTRTETATLLNELIETSHDGEKGYAKAARRAESPSLTAVFVESAMRCREGARELEARVRDLGHEPLRGGSLAGALHRGWIGLRTASTDDDDRALLEECERGEAFAGARFEMGLEAPELPPDLRAVLERQYEGVRENQARLRSLLRQQPAAPRPPDPPSRSMQITSR